MTEPIIGSETYDPDGRGTGWHTPLERTPLRVAASAAHLDTIGAETLPREFMLTRPDWVQNQGSEQSCLERTGTGMIYEINGDKCSVYVPWFAARTYDDPLSPMRNVGSTASAFLTAMRGHGAAPLGDWEPGVPGWGMNERPPALSRIKAQRRNLDLVALYAFGDQAVDGFRAALLAGYPGGIVVNVDHGYDNPTNGYVGPEAGPSRGQHEILVKGWKDDGEWFWSVGSWGTGYGLGGGVWIHRSRVANCLNLTFARGVS